MTVSAETPITSSVANGATTSFPYSFTINDADDLVVQGTLAGVTTIYQSGVDFTITGLGESAGSVDFLSAPASSTIVTLYRDTSLERNTDYQGNGDLLAAVVNRDFDRLWQALQDLTAGGKTLPLTLRVPNGESVDALPPASERAGYYLGFGPTGAPALLLAAAGTAGALATDLATTNNATKAAGQIGYSSALAYAAGTIGAKLRDGLSVKDAPFNATGDGVSNDTSALDLAEAAAFAAGKPLLIPPGTYLYTGHWTVRVPVIGYGATIKQGNASVIPTNAFGVVYVGASGVTISGLTVDANLKSTGFGSNGFSNLTFRDCVALNCVNMGFTAYNGDNLLWDRCRANTVRYHTTGVGGNPADGFYVGGCTRSTWRGCWANDVRRIGFVAESDGATKSDLIAGHRCIASNTNNCDDSTTEFNAGFWAENTHNVDWVDCVGYNIAGNAGQTSGRVRGMIAHAIGNSLRGKCNVVRCRVYGGSGYMPIGISLGGTGTNADALVEDCYVQKARTALSSQGGHASLTIRGLSGDDIVNSSSGDGGIVVDGTGPTTISNLLIESPLFTNSTFNADSGWVNFFAAPASCSYTLRRMQGGTHVMRGSVSRLRVEESVIACGSPTYSTFLAAAIELVDNHFTSRNGSASDYIVNASSLANGSQITIRGGTISGFGSGWTNEIGGTDITLRAYGVRYDLFTYNISTVGTFLNRFESCEFFNVPVTVGSIRTNFNATPTKQILIVLGCYFQSANAADTPIRLWNNAPTNAILQGNTRRVATNLHNLGAITSDVNNVGPI